MTGHYVPTYNLQTPPILKAVSSLKIVKNDLPYLSKLLKLKWSFSFIFVLVGALVGTKFQFVNINLINLLAIFFLFQLWYGAIYIINDLIDYASDITDPKKSKRIIASGLISKTRASYYAVIALIVSGISSYALSPKLLWFEIFFLSFNLLYSLALKKIAYVDSFANGVTHGSRAYMGMVLFGGYIVLPVIIACYLFAVCAAILKRLREKQGNQLSRLTLAKYSISAAKHILVVIGIISVWSLLIQPSSDRLVPLVLIIAQTTIVYCFFSYKASTSKYFTPIMKLYD